MKRFDGKVALVTGGGTGIGAAVARRLAAEGAQVVVTGRRPGPIEEVAAEIGGLAIAGDVGNEEHAQQVVDVARSTYGGLDVLVANAATEHHGSVENVTLDGWHDTLRTNLDGPMLAARCAIPAMRARGGGAIVMVSSVGAITPGQMLVAYNTSKTAMIGLCRCIARDFGGERIRANIICPGWVRTEMAERALGAVAAHTGVTLDELIAKMMKPYPLARMALSSEIAASIAFLASDDAAYVTGTTLMVDGGGSVVEPGTIAFG